MMTVKSLLMMVNIFQLNLKRGRDTKPCVIENPHKAFASPYQPWDFFGGDDAKAETPVLWPPHAKS